VGERLVDPYFAVIVLLAFWSGVFLTLGALEDRRSTRRAQVNETGRP
jgi:hypothetical protein